MAEPLPICHLNGQLLPLREARISPLDRSCLFGDAVYEVAAVRHGRAARLSANIARLIRSLGEVRIRNPHTAERWSALVNELIAANGGGDVYVYLQVSRGTEFGRNAAPLPDLEPTVFAFCAPLPPTPPEVLAEGVSCVSLQDTRWARCDIKSVALLANVLLRQESHEAGAAEAILLRDGFLTEGSSSAVHVIIDGQIRTPPRTHQVLPGTTRGFIEELASANGIVCHNVPVSETELRSADEIWLSAAIRGLVAVTTLDGVRVGSGRPGPLWQRVYALLSAVW